MRSAIHRKSCRSATAQAQHARKSKSLTEVILVAVGLGAGSRAALRFAGELARAQGCKLRLVHATPEHLPVAPLLLPKPSAASGDSWNRDTWRASLQETLQDWARREASETVADENIRVEFCQPAALILREAARPDVKLVIFGGLPSEIGTENARLPQELLRHCARPMLFVGPQGPRPIVIAATDCSDPALPVFSAAWSLAAMLGDQVCLVHNVDPTASQFAERIGMPIDPALANLVALRSKDWLEKRASSDDVIITRDCETARGILGAARSLEADVLVVGVKPAEKSRHGTAERILHETRRSVLFVPLRERAVLESEPQPG